MLNIDVLCYVIPKEKKQDAIRYFGKEYGRFNYDSLEKHTYVQGLAQMYRNVSGDKVRKQNKSWLYEELVLPALQSEDHVLDFGCGKGAYVNMLKRSHVAVGVEFYNNNKAGINVSLGEKQIDEYINHIKQFGLFDVVVCDSVLNSVDCIKAEDSVLGVLNASCKMGGKVFISGRKKQKMDQYLNASKAGETKGKNIRFFDENLFTADFRKGHWYYQHFHTYSIYDKIEDCFGFKVLKIKENNSTWRVQCEKVKDIPNGDKIEAVKYEFSLPLPNGKRYNRSTEVLQTLGLE